MLLGKNRTVPTYVQFDEFTNSYSNEKFDLVISNFGGLNCIDQNELEMNSSKQLCTILEDNGKLFFVIMGAGCVVGNFIFFIKRKILEQRSGDRKKL